MRSSIPTTARLTASGLALLALAVLYVALAPAACGGPVTYTRIAGTSMRPALEPGDLVLARPAERYAPGDVVVYHNPDLGLVMHRIAAADNDRLSLKGDANGWTDSHRPTTDEIAGKLWLRLPGAGNLVDWFRPPWGTSLLLLSAFLAIALPRLRVPAGGGRPRARFPRGVPKRGSPRAGARAGRPLTMYSPEGAVLSVAAVLVALAAAGIAAYAYMQPTRATAVAHDRYEQTGTFRYSAAAPSGIYDAAQVPAGQPVFLRLTPALHVEFDYLATSERAGSVEGSARLTAVLSQENGWQRTFALGADSPIAAGRAQLAGSVDLAALRKLIEQVEAATGVKYEAYRLAVTPEVHAQLDDPSESHALVPFAPKLVFRLSATQLQLERQGDGTGNPLEASATGNLARMSPAAASFSAMGVRVSITTLRRWSLPALGVALALLAVLGTLTLRATRRGEPHRINAQYGALITTAHLVRPPETLPLIFVGTFEDLAVIALRAGFPVIRDATDLANYLVFTQEATYHYRAASDVTRRPAPVVAAPRADDVAPPADDVASADDAGQRAA